MTLHEFINRVRSLYNIDHYLLPELSDEQWIEFRDDPPRYFINAADKPQAEAIFREIENRQRTDRGPTQPSANRQSDDDLSASQALEDL